MNLTGENWGERLELMRKRRAHFSDIVKGYTSLEDFNQEWDEKMCLWGIEMSTGETCSSLYLPFDFDENEEYYVVMGKGRHLTIDAEVGFYELGCPDHLINVETGNVCG